MSSLGHVLGKLVLPDYRPFIPIVGKAYVARPKVEPGALPSWRALISHIETLYTRMLPKVAVEFVSRDPYPSYEVMREDIRRNRRLKVYTGDSDHPAWSREQNWKFRAVHDYIVHLGGDHGFTLRGEMSAYNRHVKLAPPTARPALFTEIVGQVATFFYLEGKFPEQKIAFLYGFDYVHVGRWDAREYERNFT